MVYGTNGKYGTWGTLESASCRFQKRIKVPNPSLSATIESTVIYYREMKTGIENVRVIHGARDVARAFA